MTTLASALFALLASTWGAQAIDLKTERQQYGIDEEIVVVFKDGPGNTHDWITIVPTGAADGSAGQRKNLLGTGSGSVTFRGLPAGDYEARFHLQATQGAPAARHAFSVGGPAGRAQTPGSTGGPSGIPGRTGPDRGPLGESWTGTLACAGRDFPTSVSIIELSGLNHALVNVLDDAMPPTNPRRHRLTLFAQPPANGKTDGVQRWTFLGGTAGGWNLVTQRAPGGDQLFVEATGCTRAAFARARSVDDSPSDLNYVGAWTGQYEKCRLRNYPMLSARMRLGRASPGQYYLDMEYSAQRPGAADGRGIVNRRIFHGRWDDKARKIAFRVVAALTTTQDGQPNPSYNFVINLETITLEYDEKEKRLFGVSDTCPFGEFTREGVPVSDPAAPPSPAMRLAGDWEGYARCGQARETPVTLTLTPFGALRFRGVIEYVYGSSLSDGVIRQAIVGEPTPAGDGFVFSVEQTLLPVSGQAVPRGFTLKQRADGTALAATHAGLPCSAFDVTRVSEDSLWRRPSVAMPADGGSFHARRRPHEKCEAFATWFRKVLSEYPGLVPAGTGTAIYPKAALLFADDDFVPVFGAPFDKLDLAKRLEIAKALRDNMCRQPEFRNSDLERWVNPEWKFEEKVERPTTQMGITAIHATIRETRRLRTMIRTALASVADGTNFTKSLEVLAPVEREMRANSEYLWPSEYRAALEQVEGRLSRAALAEVDRDLARIAAIADPVARLSELKRAHQGGSEYKKYLSQADRAAFDARVLVAQRATAEGAIGPTISSIEGTRVADGALEQIETLVRRIEPMLAQLVDNLAAEYRGRVDKKRLAVFEALVAQRLAALRKLEPTKDGLAASAKWPADLKASFANLETTEHYKKALVEHRAIRNRLLRDAMSMFEADLKRVPNDDDRVSAYSVVLSHYLIWEHDRSLASALEYELVVETYKAAVPKLDPSKLSEEEFRSLYIHQLFVIGILQMCGDDNKKDITTPAHKHHRLLLDFMHRGSDVIQAIAQRLKRLDDSAQTKALIDARLEEEERVFAGPRGIKDEAHLKARYCSERAIPAITSGQWDFRRDQRTRPLIAKMSGR
jgi:hypothetical protein